MFSHIPIIFTQFHTLPHISTQFQSLSHNSTYLVHIVRVIPLPLGRIDRALTYTSELTSLLSRQSYLAYTSFDLTERLYSPRCRVGRELYYRVYHCPAYIVVILISSLSNRWSCLIFLFSITIGCCSARVPLYSCHWGQQSALFLSRISRFFFSFIFAQIDGTLFHPRV